jgi:hypothetical protein
VVASSSFLPLLEVENARKKDLLGDCFQARSDLRKNCLRERVQNARDERTGLTFKEWVQKYVDEDTSTAGPAPIFRERDDPSDSNQDNYLPSSPQPGSPAPKFENVSASSDSDFDHLGPEDDTTQTKYDDLDWD